MCSQSGSGRSISHGDWIRQERKKGYTDHTDRDGFMGKLIVNDRLSVISYQLSVISLSCQLSVVSYQSSVVSVISYQLSVIRKTRRGKRRSVEYGNGGRREF